MVQERRVRYLLVVALLPVVTLGFLLSACSGRPKTLDGALVPSSILSDEAMIMGNTKVIGEKKWYTYQKTQDYEWYATRCFRDMDGQTMEQWTIRGLSTSVDPEKEWKLGVGFRVEDKVFYGDHGEQTLRRGSSSLYNIVAVGIVTDPSVAKVVGTTVNGDTVSTAPANSCWFLVVVGTNPANGWRVAEAQDSSGKVLYTLTFKTPPERPS